MDTKQKTFQEIFEKVEKGEVYTCEGKFDKAIVVTRYAHLISLNTEKGENIYLYADEPHSWKNYENLKHLKDFDVNKYLEDAINNIETFKELIPEFKKITEFDSNYYKFLKASAINEGNNRYVQVTFKVDLPYVDLEYGFKESTSFKKFQLKDSGKQFLEMFNIPSNILKINTSNLDSKKEKYTNILTKNTFFSLKFRNLISKLECNEDLKTYLLDGKFNFDMQFIHITANKNISFTPKNKTIDYNLRDYLEGKNRQEMRPHKFFNRVFKGVKGATEYEIKCFTDNCIAMLDTYTIEYVSDNDIGEYYSNIETDDWVTDSCMWGAPEGYFEIYADNKFELGIIKRNDEIVGRFLKVNADNGFTYNDRIYYADHEVLAWYNSYVDTHDLIRKKDGSLKVFYQKSRGEFNENVIFTLVKPITDYEYLPYVDTLRYVGKGYITLNNYSYLGISLESTEGEYEGMDTEWDDYDEKFIEYCDLVTISGGSYDGKQTHYTNCKLTEDNRYILK